MKFAIIPVETIRAIEDRAIAEGRHCRIEDHRFLCGGCGSWVKSISYGTIDRKDLCADCADKIGKGPKSIAQWQADRERRIAAMRLAQSGGINR